MSIPMPERRLSEPCPGSPFAFQRVATDPPRRNHVLAALPALEYQRLRPDLNAVALPLGSTIYDAGEQERHLYFLTGGLVARLYVTESGASAEFAVTGREGVIGIASFLGGESTLTRAVVLNAGHAYRLRAELLQQEFRRDSTLARLLLRYVHALMAQTGQNAVCNRHHSLEQRLCRWILTCLDQLGSNELVMTHQMIAHMLGVRREGVTQAVGRLQQAGLIACSRGRMVLLERPELQARACECYSVLKQCCDRQLPEIRRQQSPKVTRFPLPALA